MMLTQAAYSLDVRLGQITYTGTTGGTLPFTSFNSSQSNNTFDSKLNRYPGGRQNYTIALTNQGLRATVSCTDATSSPLSMSTTLPAGTSPLACNPHTPISAMSPHLRMRAGYCNSTVRPTEGTNNPYPSYEFYMRFDGDYINRGPDGQTRNEKVTCQLTPRATTEHAEFQSLANSTRVIEINEARITGIYPQALVERILSTMVSMMTVLGQNSVGKLLFDWSGYLRQIS